MGVRVLRRGTGAWQGARPEAQLLGTPWWQGTEVGAPCSHRPRHQGSGHQAAGVLTTRSLRVPCQTPLSFFLALLSRKHSCVVTKMQG